MPSEVWSVAVVVGPILLALAMVWGWLQTRKHDREVDPLRSSDDPSFGMKGADVSPDTVRKDADPDRR